MDRAHLSKPPSLLAQIVEAVIGDYSDGSVVDMAEVMNAVRSQLPETISDKYIALSIVQEVKLLGSALDI